MQQVLRSTVVQDDFIAAAAEAFDFPFNGVTEFVVPEFVLPTPDFGLLLIVGPSGSGKSTILKQYFGGESPPPVWDVNRAVISHFNNPQDAIQRLSNIGLNSIPAWLRPRQVLSNGEGHRVDLARTLNHGAVIDEFTSVVNREAAQATAAGVRRLIDAYGLRRVVIASVHYDIIAWLQPDFVFDVATGVVTPRGSLPPRPRIRLEIFPASTAIWPVFAPHHYLTAKLHRSANCWIAVWDGVMVGFASSISFPHGHIKNAYREHRTVILPDYQGLGLGVRLSDAIAEIHRMEGKRYFSRTAHPRMGHYRDQSADWRATSSSRKRQIGTGHDKSLLHGKCWTIDTKRITYSHEYVGLGLA